MDFYAIIIAKPIAQQKILGRRVIDYMLADLAKAQPPPKEVFVTETGASAQSIMEKYPDAEFTIIKEAQIASYPPIVDRRCLAEVTRQMAKDINDGHMANGVTIISPENTFIGSDVKIGADTVIYPGTIIEGDTTIGEGCTIGRNCRIVDTKIGNGAEIWQSVCLQSEIGEETTVGPFAHLRPKSVIAQNCRIGNFVEVKNAVFGDDSKAGHLAYIGDATIGKKVNIGCGAITVNYDGRTKSHTLVEDDAFIGSNANLIAPVTVNKGAYVAAGSTITRNVPTDALALGRARQENKENWVKKKRGT